MRISEIAKQIGARVEGEDVAVRGVASVASATASDLVFVDDPKHLAAALNSPAAAVIAGEFAAHESAKPVLVAAQPRLAFAQAAALLAPTLPKAVGVGRPHASAVIDPSARIAASCNIGPHVVVEAGVTIGERTTIAANTFVGAGVSIGDDCDLRSNVSIYSGTSIGHRVIVHAGAVLGSDGFGFVRDRQSGKYTKFPQLGRLDIHDDVEIGANTTIDRGALDVTVIARGTKLDNLVQVGHNVRVGEDVVIASQTGISGSSIIENGVVIAGQVGIGDHARIEEGAVLGGQSGVLPGKIVRAAGEVLWGTPVRPLKQYLRELATLARLSRRRKE